MHEKVNQRRKGDFVDSFMAHYVSAGINIPLDERVYKNAFTIIEQRTGWRVIIGEETKRYSNLCMVAEFIWDRCFDPQQVYIPPDTPAQARKRANKLRIERNYWLEKLKALLMVKAKLITIPTSKFKIIRIPGCPLV